MVECIEDVLLGTEVQIIVHDKAIDLAALLEGWSSGERGHLPRKTEYVEGTTYCTRVGYEPDDDWVCISIMPGRRLKVTRHDGGDEEFSTDKVFSHALALQQRLTGMRIPYSVLFEDIKRPLAAFPLLWCHSPDWGAWWFMRQNYIVAQVDEDFTAFCVPHADGAELLLDKEGFHYRILESTAERVTLSEIMLESLRMVHYGMDDCGPQPPHYIRYHFQTMLHSLTYFPEAAKPMVLDAYSELFRGQLFRAGHITAESKQGLYSDFEATYRDIASRGQDWQG
jgi:hypothetical protein